MVVSSPCPDALTGGMGGVRWTTDRKGGAQGSQWEEVQLDVPPTGGWGKK